MNNTSNVLIDFYTISKGIAIGEVLIYYAKNPIVKRQSISEKEIHNQILKFDQIIHNQINVLSKHILDNKSFFSKDDLVILEINLNFLKDKIFWDEIKEYSLKEHVNIDFAFDLIKNNYLQNFDKNDPYWYERAKDIENIYNHIINIFQGNSLFDIDDIKNNTILIGDNFDLNLISKIDTKKIVGIISYNYSPTSHSSILIKNLNIPFISIKNDNLFKDKDVVIIDAIDNQMFLNPGQKQINLYKQKLNDLFKNKNKLSKFKNVVVKTKDNHLINVMANISGNNDMKNFDEYQPDGIGLFRTEFLFLEAYNWPSEEYQFELYKQIAKQANHKDVIIRTLDIGADKHLDYYNFDKENNPSLGSRAIRFSLDNQIIFKEQLRAIIRAHDEYDNIKIMFPMISTVEELVQCKKLVSVSYKELKKNNPNLKPIDNLEIGIMIETPSSIFLSSHLAKKVNFFSFGTNDLIQYSFAADRTNSKMNYLYQPYNPSILNQMDYVIKNAHKNNIKICICGDMASDENIIPLLVGLDIDKISINIQNTWIIKNIITNLDYIECKNLVKKALKLDTQKKVKNLLK